MLGLRDGSDIDSGTVGGDVWDSVTNPHFAFAGGLQPGLVSSLLGSGNNLDGFANRFNVEFIPPEGGDLGEPLWVPPVQLQKQSYPSIADGESTSK